jgi:hypothetical protein
MSDSPGTLDAGGVFPGVQSVALERATQLRRSTVPIGADEAQLSTLPRPVVSLDHEPPYTEKSTHFSNFDPEMEAAPISETSAISLTSKDATTKERK